MLTNIDDAEIRELIEIEERRSGLRPDGQVDAAAVERRRMQIVLVGIVVVLGLLAHGAIRLFLTDRPASFLTPTAGGIVMAFVAGGFAAYALATDRHLKRLLALGDELLRVERETARRLLARAAFADDQLALHESLDLSAVLTTFVRRCTGITAAHEGSVFFVEPDGAIVRLARHSENADPSGLRISRTIADTVLATGDPLLLPPERAANQLGHVSGAVLVARIGGRGSECFIALVAEPGCAFLPDDVAWVAEYAARAGVAIQHARWFEAALLRGEYLGQRAVATTADELSRLAYDLRSAADHANEQLTPDARHLLASRLQRAAAGIDDSVQRARAAMLDGPLIELPR